MMAGKILDVPKIKQLRGEYCAVASLNMVLSYYGYEIAQKELANFFHDPECIKDEGVFYKDVAFAAGSLGFKAEEYYNFTLENIINCIDNGTPIIARGKSHTSPRCRHFRVIKGYETNPSYVYVNDPYYTRRNRFSYDTFRSLWLIKGSNGTKNYGVVIKPN